MSEEETIQALQYISDSPDQEHGGFHPQTKETAHNAIHVILGLNQKLLAAQLRESKLMEALLCAKQMTSHGYHPNPHKPINEWFVDLHSEIDAALSLSTDDSLLKEVRDALQTSLNGFEFIDKKMLNATAYINTVKHALQLFGAATPPEACPPVTAQSAQCSGLEKL